MKGRGGRTFIKRRGATSTRALALNASLTKMPELSEYTVFINYMHKKKFLTVATCQNGKSGTTLMA